MGLPGGEHVVITCTGEEVMGHAGAETLDVPFLGAMQAELAIETFGPDLGRHPEEEHAREAAAVGVGRVVITGALQIEPDVDHLEAVAAWDPGAAALGWLAVDHMPDPALTTRQDHLPAEVSHNGVVEIEFPLEFQLARKPGGGIRTGLRMAQDCAGQPLEIGEQRRRKLTFQQIPWKQFAYRHRAGMILG